jgi:hypothetical protein
MAARLNRLVCLTALGTLGGLGRAGIFFGVLHESA